VVSRAAGKVGLGWPRLGGQPIDQIRHGVCVGYGVGCVEVLLAVDALVSHDKLFALLQVPLADQALEAAEVVAGVFEGAVL